jgi:hypothetical protein
MYLGFFITIFLIVFLGFIIIENKKDLVKKGFGYGLLLASLFTLVNVLLGALFGGF